MTSEAQEWILGLVKDPRNVFYEIHNGPEGTSAVLDIERITDEEHEKAIQFAKNGSPRITVEYRDQDYSR